MWDFIRSKRKLFGGLGAIVAVVALLFSILVGGPVQAATNVTIIAASNSSSQWKSEATATCTGTDDQNTINTYLTAGSTVELAPGTFNINEYILLGSSTHLYGQGNTTILNFSNANILMYEVSNVEVNSFEITGTANNTIGAAIFINVGYDNESNISVHDVSCNATGSQDFCVYSNGNNNLSNLTFCNDDANAPDGCGFMINGEGGPFNVQSVTFYHCTVENAGIAATRITPWAVGFDFCEYSGVNLNGLYAINCSVNGAWESDFHFEDAPTKENVVLTGCNAINAGQKPDPLYGYGYLIGSVSDEAGDIIEYNNTASNDTGGDLDLDATVHTPMIDGISPSNSLKTAANVNQGNCSGVIVNLDPTHKELVLYSNNGSAVDQAINLGGYYAADDGNSYTFNGESIVVQFNNYAVIGLVKTTTTTTTTPVTTTTTTTTAYTPSGYSLNFTVATNGSISGLTPILLSTDTSALVANHVIQANGLDVKMLQNGTVIPDLVNSSGIAMLGNLTANSNANFVFSGGNAPVSSMPLILGIGGYVTIPYNAALAEGTNWSKSITAYFDTTAGAGKYIINKANTLLLGVDASTSGTIDATVYGTNTTINQSAYTGTQAVYSTTTACGENISGIASGQTLLSASLYLDKSGSPTGTISCNVYRQSDGTLIGTLGTMSAASLTGSMAYYTFNTTPVSLGSTTNFIIAVAYAGDSGNYINVGVDTANPYAFGTEYTLANGIWTSQSSYDLTWQNLIYATACTTGIAGISSGLHTITISMSDGTFYLQDEDTETGSSFSGSIANNSAVEILDQNNVMPYITSYSESVGSSEVLKYQPNTIISGTVLPDSDGTQAGVITWGTFLTNGLGGLSGGTLTLVASSFVASEPNVGTGGGSGDLVTGTPSEPDNMYGDMDTSNIPGANIINDAFNSAGVPTSLFWIPFALATICLAAWVTYAGTKKVNTFKNQLGNGTRSMLFMSIAADVVTAIWWKLGVLPGMLLFFFILAETAIILSAKQFGW